MKVRSLHSRAPILAALSTIAAVALISALGHDAPSARAAGSDPASAAAAAAAPAATDWPQWLGPNRNGISEEAGWRTDWTANAPKELWRKKVGEGFTCVSVAAGHLYTSGNAGGKDTVFCLNPAMGAEIWTFSYRCESGDYPGTRCVPTVDGASLYTFNREGVLYCLSADKGAVRWQKDIVKDCGVAKPMWGFATQPLILGDRVIMTVGPTIALDKATGKVVWKSGEDKAAHSSAYAFQHGGKTLVAGMNLFGLRVVDAADGKEVARFKWETPAPVHVVTPIVEGDNLFVASFGTSGVLKLGDDGLRPVWLNKNLKNHANNSMLFKENLYGFDGEVDKGILRCVDFKTGEVRWSNDDIKAGALMVADGKLLIMSSKGDLIVAEASPAAYKEIGRTHVLDGRCWTMPVLSGGLIYCRNHPGDLVCVDVRKKP
jgi:outer membrane protein assembly factor BamB